MDIQPATSQVASTRLRWWLHLAILTAYPIVLGIIGFAATREAEHAMLPDDSRGLLLTAAVEIVVFGIVFTLAVVTSGATADELMLRWRDGFRPIWHGLVYSVLLRAVVMLAVMAIAFAAAIVSGGAAEALKVLRPETENVVDARTLADPLYLFLTLTLISFVVAALREELWRAGMLAALGVLFPTAFESRRGTLFAALAVAVVFGIGHLTQGIGGVIVTTGLGFGLGWIMLHYRSIWGAVFAHGFFDATTFAMLYLLGRFHPEAIGIFALW